jgi:hypothetical protein
VKESGYMDVEVDGKTDKVASEINAAGMLTGQIVQIEAVHSFSTLIGIMSRRFFSA